MAERVYTEYVNKNCPRCGSNTIVVEVFHLETTHKPMCSECGLTTERQCSSEKVVKAVMVDTYYNYEYKIKSQNK